MEQIEWKEWKPSINVYTPWIQVMNRGEKQQNTFDFFFFLVYCTVHRTQLSCDNNHFSTALYYHINVSMCLLHQRPVLARVKQPLPVAEKCKVLDEQSLLDVEVK